MPHPPFTVETGSTETTFYRVVAQREIRTDDFFSDERAAKEFAQETENMAIHRGCSVQATFPQARSVARLLARMSGTPRYVALVRLDPAEGGCFARTFRKRGHHTLWGDAALLAGRANIVDEETV